MTRETRTLIECGDIVGIELECRACKTKVVYPLETTGEKISPRCPNSNCKADLFLLNPATSEGPDRKCQSLDNVETLVKMVKYLAANPKDLKANVRLHVTPPERI